VQTKHFTTLIYIYLIMQPQQTYSLVLLPV